MAVGNLHHIFTASTKKERKSFSPNNHLKTPWGRTLTWVAHSPLVQSPVDSLGEAVIRGAHSVLEGMGLFPDEGEEPGRHPSLENVISAEITGVHYCLSNITSTPAAF